MARDINFSEGNDRFNFRVAIYITHGDEVLVQGSHSAGHHNLIGGRVQMGENTYEAIQRELKEELNLSGTTPTLIQIAENRFDWQGKKVQELVFIYHLEAEGETYDYLQSIKNVMDNDDDYLVWTTKQNLKNLKCLPALIYDLPTLDLNHITHTTEG